ncbi:MAG: HD domain-containing protein [Syntrophobacteraceae bacterium]|jgi:putative hydrolase of HD superfamily|nr:HD domain-containing protein [Syntrophobacteraceae bacterium]
MLRRALLLKLFSAATMLRWNDKIRPMDLTELDKQAHKMVLAYFLGKWEEERGELDWIGIIEGGLFELLQRVVLTDLKPPLFYRIKSDPARYGRLNDWVGEQLSPILSPLGAAFQRRFREYFDEPEDGVHHRVLDAAHLSATCWEFDILYRMNPGGFEMEAIRERLSTALEPFGDLAGMARLREDDASRRFIDLCGQLRFQVRWANIHRAPRTSVLGHSLIVAFVAYLFSMQVGACRARRINNFFTGLFHDLPEVLTRDVISPVKRSIEGLDAVIKEYEREMMDQDFYGLLPPAWRMEMRLFAEDELENVARVDGESRRVGSGEIGRLYNEDRYSPRDGELVKASDRLAAFIEAYLAIRNGSAAPDLHEAFWAIRSEQSHLHVAGIDLGGIYADFD